MPLPVTPALDSIDRAVEFVPPKLPYDPRSMLAGSTSEGITLSLSLPLFTLFWFLFHSLFAIIRWFVGERFLWQGLIPWVPGYVGSDRGFWKGQVRWSIVSRLMYSDCYFQETVPICVSSCATPMLRLGGIPCGVIAVETRSMELIVPADPANPDSEAKVSVASLCKMMLVSRGTCVHSFFLHVRFWWYKHAKKQPKNLSLTVQKFFAMHKWC